MDATDGLEVLLWVAFCTPAIWGLIAVILEMRRHDQECRSPRDSKVPKAELGDESPAQDSRSGDPR